MKKEAYLLIATFIFLTFLLPSSNGQSPTPPPTSNGYNCFSDRTAYPCRAYAFYRAGADPTLLDLASIADLFGAVRRTIATSSNLSATSPLRTNQPLLVPLTCACNYNISYAAVDYQIAAGDTFYLVSSFKFGNLTSYPAVETVNPSLIPTKLEIGDHAVFPIFCQCPVRSNATTNDSSSAAIVTYSFQQSDTFASIASEFGTDVRSLVSLNGPEKSIRPFTTILIPVSKVPPPLLMNHSVTPPPAPPPPAGSVVVIEKNGREGALIGLSIGLGILGLLLPILLVALVRFRRRSQERGGRGEEKGKGEYYNSGQGGGRRGLGRSASDEKLMSDISEMLDKYKVYRIQELREATGDFDAGHLIQGSVYKGIMDGEAYAIKKMKWNACDELKILQKVNHTNLVKLEGFCIEPDAGTCFLIYEYVENGSLHSWLHDPSRACRLDWRARLRIALDLAHGLQYIHEHTWPRVVHKDIKTSNVLLDSHMRAKIANFGLAKTGCNAVTTHIVGTQGYIAPEYLADGLVTTKMDVFAYGVVLLELVSGREAVSEEGELLWMEVEGMFERRDGRVEGRLGKWVHGAVAEERAGNMESVVSVVNIARACLQRDAARRPSMVDVAYTLSKADDLFSDFSGDGLMVGESDVVIGR